MLFESIYLKHNTLIVGTLQMSMKVPASENRIGETYERKREYTPSKKNVSPNMKEQRKVCQAGIRKGAQTPPNPLQIVFISCRAPFVRSSWKLRSWPKRQFGILTGNEIHASLISSTLSYTCRRQEPRCLDPPQLFVYMNAPTLTRTELLVNVL